MDPLAHSLAGATIAQTGLRKLTPLATVTLVIAANLPDIDGVAHFFGGDAALFYRRGITHGVLAMVLLPVALTFMILMYDKYRRLLRNPQAKPAKFGAILLLSAIGIWSHPLLDLLNTYGVRLLSPFDNRWFYGDILFIIDAWMWLLMAVSVVFACSKSRFSQFLWVILGIATSSIISLTDFVPATTQYTWFFGIAIIVLVRTFWLQKINNKYIALACLSAFLTYLAFMATGNFMVKNAMKDWISTKSETVGIPNPLIENMMVGPIPGNPLAREVIIQTQSHYFGAKTSVLDAFDLEAKEPQILFAPVKISEEETIRKKVLNQKAIQGFTNWMRFPLFEVTPSAVGEKITIRDLRYVRPHDVEGRGIGMVSVMVP